LRRANNGIFSTIRDYWSGRGLVFDPPLLHPISPTKIGFR
jgi:hypothetical protein